MWGNYQNVCISFQGFAPKRLHFSEISFIHSIHYHTICTSYICFFSTKRSYDRTVALRPKGQQSVVRELGMSPKGQHFHRVIGHGQDTCTHSHEPCSSQHASCTATVCPSLFLSATIADVLCTLLRTSEVLPPLRSSRRGV